MNREKATTTQAALEASGMAVTRKTASARLPTAPIWPDVVPVDATDYAAIRLMALRKRGSGINLRKP